MIKTTTKNNDVVGGDTNTLKTKTPTKKMQRREPAGGQGKVHGDGRAVERFGLGEGGCCARRAGSSAGESAAVL